MSIVIFVPIYKSPSLRGGTSHRVCQFGRWHRCKWYCETCFVQIMSYSWSLRLFGKLDEWMTKRSNVLIGQSHCSVSLVNPSLQHLVKSKWNIFIDARSSCTIVKLEGHMESVSSAKDILFCNYKESWFIPAFRVFAASHLLLKLLDSAIAVSL